VGEALDHVLSELTEMLGAHRTWWMGTLRLSDIAGTDPISGWRPRVIHNLQKRPERESMNKEQVRHIEQGTINEGVIAMLRNVGCFRVNILHEIVPPEWFQSDHYEQCYKDDGLRDAIYVVVPLGENVESWMAFERNGLDKPLYSDNERELLDYAMRPMKWFHRQLVLAHGVTLVDEPLSDSERRVLPELLTDKTKQEIGTELALSPATVHTYSAEIFRKYGVRGRMGLKALWLGNMLEE